MHAQVRAPGPQRDAARVPERQAQRAAELPAELQVRPVVPAEEQLVRRVAELPVELPALVLAPEAQVERLAPEREQARVAQRVWERVRVRAPEAPLERRAPQSAGQARQDL